MTDDWCRLKCEEGRHHVVGGQGTTPWYLSLFSQESEFHSMNWEAAFEVYAGVLSKITICILMRNHGCVRQIFDTLLLYYAMMVIHYVRSVGWQNYKELHCTNIHEDTMKWLNKK